MLAPHLCQCWLDHPEGLRLEGNDGLVALNTETKGGRLGTITIRAPRGEEED
jgi:hypothetical protein